MEGNVMNNQVTGVANTKSGSGFFYGWWIVVASIIGLALGYSVVAVMSFGTFIKPLEESFGWTRGQISLGPTIIGLTAIIVFPYTGALVDRFGVRRILLPSTILFGLAIGSMYFLTPSLWHLYAMCVAIPILGAGTAPMTYSRLIVAWFDKRRGLALGVGLAGVGLGTTLVPMIASYFIEHYSWREAYLVLGAMIILLVWPVAKLLLKESPGEMGLFPDGSDFATDTNAHSDTRVGYIARQAVRQKTFWLMAGSFVIAGLCTSTILVHLIPMMMDRGLTLQQAAGTFAYLGIALMGGRLVAGYLMDRIFAPYVVIFFLMGPVIGLALFANGATGTTAALCAALIGMAIGVEFDVMAFFTSRYFGPRSFGQIYGYNYSAFKIGSSIGPLIMGVSFDMLGRYDEVLWALSGTCLLGCVLVAGLGAYPKLPVEEEPG
jgi:MFS family permease